MKKFSAFLLAVATVLAVSAPLSAQDLPLVANIPFEFSVGNTTLPAGEYRITQAASSSVVTLRGVDTNSAVATLTAFSGDHNRPQGEASLTFNRYGNSYFLSAIWNGYRGIGNVLRPSHTETELNRSASTQKFEVLAFLAKR